MSAGDHEHYLQWEPNRDVAGCSCGAFITGLEFCQLKTHPEKLARLLDQRVSVGKVEALGRNMR